MKGFVRKGDSSIRIGFAVGVAAKSSSIQRQRATVVHSFYRVWNPSASCGTINVSHSLLLVSVPSYVFVAASFVFAVFVPHFFLWFSIQFLLPRKKVILGVMSPSILMLIDFLIVSVMHQGLDA